MALIVHSSSSPFTHHHLPRLTTPTLFTIKAQTSSTEPPPSTQSVDDTSSSPKKPNSTGLGFVSSTTNKKQKGRRERASIIRRAPVENPRFVSQQQGGESKEQGRNESAFLLTWLGLGSIIIIEGILLAASGFLPEEWDKYFVKYLYPSFTPTVFLFVAGTVVYGVVKYLENEKPNSSS